VSFKLDPEIVGISTMDDGWAEESPTKRIGDDMRRAKVRTQAGPTSEMVYDLDDLKRTSNGEKQRGRGYGRSQTPGPSPRRLSLPPQTNPRSRSIQRP
jgi:hypothetical protein